MNWCLHWNFTDTGHQSTITSIGSQNGSVPKSHRAIIRTSDVLGSASLALCEGNHQWVLFTKGQPYGALMFPLMSGCANCCTIAVKTSVNLDVLVVIWLSGNVLIYVSFGLYLTFKYQSSIYKPPECRLEFEFTDNILYKRLDFELLSLQVSLTVPKLWEIGRKFTVL